jgi:hypothetical protein
MFCLKQNENLMSQKTKFKLKVLQLLFELKNLHQDPNKFKHV